MAAFDLAPARVQRDSQLLAERIDQLARAQHHTFRRTLLTPGHTLKLFVRQIAHGNVACASMCYLAGEEFSDSAWCQARASAAGVDRTHATFTHRRSAARAGGQKRFLTPL